MQPKGRNVRKRSVLWKILSLLFAFTLIAAACGDDSDEGSEESNNEGTEEGEEGGDVPSVGLAYDLGGRGDQSFNDSAAAGLDMATEDFGLDPEELEPDEGGENREELLRLLGDQGTQLVFGVGFPSTRRPSTPRRRTSRRRPSP